MKILYVHGHTFMKSIVEALYRLGYEVEIYPETEAGPFVKDEIVEKIVNYIHEKAITHVLSIHLQPNLAMAAYKADIKYLAIIWDAPYYQLCTAYGRMDNCYFSVFDKADYRRFKQVGIPHVLYQPLSIDWKAAWQWHGRKREYKNEISFVGGLYDDNLYDDYMQNIPETLKQYFTSIFEEAAFKWDGMNHIYGKTGTEILEYIKATCLDFILINPFEIDDIQYFESYYLARKLANIERICLLNVLAKEYEVCLFTNSIKDTNKLKDVLVKPYVDSIKAAPIVFRTSKINLNFTLHSIERGTPQRVLDIMEAGGFVMSSFSPETAELFVEDEEIVMFKSPEELMKKVKYYLAHDKEREAIAYAGYKKVMKYYTYDIKMKEFLDWVEKKE